MPEAVAPGRGRRAEEPVARPDAGAVERGDHEHDDGPVRVAHGGGQLARGAGRVLEDGEVVRRAAQLAARGIARQRGQQRVIGHDHVEVLDAARRVRLLGVRDEEPRRAVLDAEPHAIRAEQREERHGDGAPLDGAEERGVEGQRRLEHDRHAVARRHAAGREPVGEPRRPLGQLAEGDGLVPAVGVGDAHGHAVGGGVAVHALVRDVERRPVAVEQLPERGRREVTVGVGVARVVGQSAHRGVARRQGRRSAIRPPGNPGCQYAQQKVPQAQRHQRRLKEPGHGDAHGTPHACSDSARERMRNNEH